MKHQNKRRSIKAALLTAALAGVCATGAVAPSLAADVHHGGGAKLTYFYRGGKLHLVDRNGGLDGIASVYHDPITANGEP